MVAKQHDDFGDEAQDAIRDDTSNTPLQTECFNLKGFAHNETTMSEKYTNRKRKTTFDQSDYRLTDESARKNYRSANVNINNKFVYTWKHENLRISDVKKLRKKNGEFYFKAKSLVQEFKKGNKLKNNLTHAKSLKDLLRDLQEVKGNLSKRVNTGELPYKKNQYYKVNKNFKKVRKLTKKNTKRAIKFMSKGHSTPKSTNASSNSALEDPVNETQGAVNDGPLPCYREKIEQRVVCLKEEKEHKFRVKFVNQASG